jgi:hypothetical protein
VVDISAAPFRLYLFSLCANRAHVATAPLRLLTS